MSDRARPTVLVVDDEPLIRSDMAEMIAGLGYAVLEAQNADAAIGLLEAHPHIRAVITDVDMPGSMNGTALAHFIANRWPPCRLVVISGHRKLSADDLPFGARFLTKPTTPKIVDKTLHDLGLAA